MNGARGRYQVLQNGGDEDREALYGDVDAEEPGCTHVIIYIQHSTLHVMGAGLFVTGGFVLEDEALAGDVLLALIEDFGCFWPLRKHERSCEAEEDRDQALEEEDVPSSCQHGQRARGLGSQIPTSSRECA